VINLPFALVEAIQIITGQNDPQALRFYNSAIIDIQGDGPRGTPHWQDGVTRFNAAYGERLRAFNAPAIKAVGIEDVPVRQVDQLQHVIETLRRDPDSRQASIVLSHPWFDHYTRQTNDRACNVYAHAMIRNDRLDWMQIIRSNDAVWGIPYNVVQWSHVQEWVAASLNVPMGHMFIVQDSFHVYEDKYAECNSVVLFDMYKYMETFLLPMQANDMIVSELFAAERAVRSGMVFTPATLKDLENLVGLYWTDVIATLQSFREFKIGHDERAYDILPLYGELRLPLLRNYCQWRWNKDKKYMNLVQAAYLDLSSCGVPSEEADKWLGMAG
jgi:thymidylate synthase